jgi:hypothetical protein
MDGVNMPLGDYERFRRWSGKPRNWEPDGAGWRAWFGGQVIDGLCEVLDEHLARKAQSGDVARRNRLRAVADK